MSGTGGFRSDSLEDWDLVVEVELQLDTPDSHPWRFTKSG